MGFYGNITNTSKTQFQFDKVYPNRYSMDTSKATDGIYAGRYVLVEYDNEFQHDDAHRVYKINDNFYNANQADKNLLIKVNDFADGDIVYTSDIKINPSAGYNDINIVYYEVINNRATNSVDFKELISTDGNPNYTVNYNIDTAFWGAGRGYDSTVWQKVYMDGYEKYIMIAELNSVVPTFDVSADAPTLTPLIPHFDTSSTDIYYKLHWQPTWGFRVAEGMGTDVTDSEDTNAGKYPSDEKVVYTESSHNANTGKTDTNRTEYNGAIYFNRNGFEVKKHNYYNGEFNDEIAIRPTGKSGNKYNLHDGTADTAILPDIQELKVILPSLGNAICSVWDTVYGYDVNNGKRYMDIEWKDANDLSPNEEKGGMSRDVETLSGCINVTHDLLGMIVTEQSPSLTEVGYQKNQIYKIGNDYYRIRKNIGFVSTSLANTLNKEDYLTEQEYNEACENLIKDFLIKYPDKEWYTKTDKGYEKIGEKALLTVDNIAYKNGFTYELALLEGFGKDLSTINGLILQIRDILDIENTKTRNTSTVQGSINALNDIINIFKAIGPNRFIISDNDGKIISSNWTTKQDFTYTNHGGVPTNVADNSTKENQWIEVNLKDKIEIKHKSHSVDNTITQSDKNTIGTGNGLNNELTLKDKLVLYTPIVDNCGHIVGKNTETVTLPYGYKYVLTDAISNINDKDLYTTVVDATDGNNTSTIVADASSSEAESTQDKIKINPINKWIQTKITNNNGIDTLSVAHEIHAVNEVAQSTDLNANISNKDDIVLQDLEFDKAGHVIKNQQHTYTLPYGFKTIVPKAQSIATNNPEVNTNSIVADNTQDALTIASSNKWIRLSGEATSDTLSIGHEVHTFSDNASSGKYYGLTQDETISTLDKDNKFEVPSLKFDEAGHITGAQTHTVELPDNFATIDVVLNDANTSNKIIGTKGTIVANSLIDKLTLAEGNRWINIDAVPNEDKIIFSHYVNNISNDTIRTDYNDKSADKAFNIQELVWDKAGHIVSEKVHTHTLPDSIKIIAISNSGSAGISTDAVATNGSLTASNLTDTATIDTGNRWVKLIADQENKKVSIYHNAPGASANTTQTGNEVPKFGDTFKIPEIKYDQAGHVSEVATHTVLVPKPSLNDLQATSSSVLTGLQMEDATGAITQTNDNVGNLALTGYTVGTEIKDISSSDTINSAFGQAQFRIKALENNLNAEIQNRKNAIQDLDVVGSSNITASQTIKSWSETDGKISITTQDITITDKNISETANIAMSKINGLNNALSQKQNIILANTYDVYGAAAKVLGSSEDDETKITVYGLLKKIEALEKRIEALENGTE